MSAETSPAPWDLASDESWSIRSADHRIADDGNNERIVDAKGEVVAYVSGNDDGSNGALLAAAPALLDALKELLAEAEAYEENGDRFDKERNDRARAALKQAGAR